MIPRGLLIIGFGGHARSVADVALDLGIAELAFIDAQARPGEQFAGFSARQEMPPELPEGWLAFPAAGDNGARAQQIADLSSRGFPVCTLVSKRAYVGVGAAIGEGAYVAHGAHLGPDARVGRGTIINTGAVVDHESTIGDFTHVSVNTTIAGRCRIGSYVMVGAGATVIDRTSVGDNIVVGAGSTVIRNIAEPGVYVGCPVRRTRPGGE